MIFRPRLSGEKAADRMKAVGMLLATSLVLLAGCVRDSDKHPAKQASDRGAERLSIVGSSTITPFLSTAAEYFSATADFPTPVVESTGTGSGFKLFCQSSAANSVSIAMASRPVTSAERESCRANGVENIVELTLGYDGIVLVRATQEEPLTFSRAQLYLALAETVPVGETFVRNPYVRWKDIDRHLPDRKIEVLGPPTSSGTRDSFVELAMKPGALSIPALQRLEAQQPDVFETRASTFRTDGGWVDAGENDAQVVRLLADNPKALGLVGYSYFVQNAATLQAARIDGVAPDASSIADQRYGLSRELYLYVKADHLWKRAALEPFLNEIFSEAALGESGYLLSKGLIPLKAQDRESARSELARATTAAPELAESRFGKAL